MSIWNSVSPDVWGFRSEFEHTGTKEASVLVDVATAPGMPVIRLGVISKSLDRDARVYLPPAAIRELIGKLRKAVGE